MATSFTSLHGEQSAALWVVEEQVQRYLFPWAQRLS